MVQTKITSKHACVAALPALVAVAAGASLVVSGPSVTYDERSTRVSAEVDGGEHNGWVEVRWAGASLGDPQPTQWSTDYNAATIGESGQARVTVERDVVSDQCLWMQTSIFDQAGIEQAVFHGDWCSW